MHHLDAGLSGDLRPDIAGAAGPCPMLASLLAGNGDEAEIADRGADGPGVALDDGDPLALAGRGERRAEPDDAGADDDEIESLIAAHGGFPVQRVRQVWRRRTTASAPQPCSTRTTTLV
ncbi:hypothetical protein ShzoTeo12_04020 [Shinella zoogloeoides]|nr:hypothetical protein ShzoTeo12_04020 [Shinella zoogloeoides]